jgi:hypothetical protein
MLFCFPSTSTCTKTLIFDIKELPLTFLYQNSEIEIASFSLQISSHPIIQIPLSDPSNSIKSVHSYHCTLASGEGDCKDVLSKEISEFNRKGYPYILREEDAPISFTTCILRSARFCLALYYEPIKVPIVNIERVTATKCMVDIKIDSMSSFKISQGDNFLVSDAMCTIHFPCPQLPNILLSQDNPKRYHQYSSYLANQLITSNLVSYSENKWSINSNKIRTEVKHSKWIINYENLNVPEGLDYVTDSQSLEETGYFFLTINAATESSIQPTSASYMPCSQSFKFIAKPFATLSGRFIKLKSDKVITCNMIYNSNLAASFKKGVAIITYEASIHTPSQ